MHPSPSIVAALDYNTLPAREQLAAHRSQSSKLNHILVSRYAWTHASSKFISFLKTLVSTHCGRANMSDIDNLASLADALSTLDSVPMYTEARRQYETLGEESTDGNDKDSTAGGSHLQHFYATLFECATEHLDWEQKMKLLTICFAYKTRSRVLCFLELVDPKSVAWRDPLKDVVERAGRDTMFPDAPAQRPTPTPKPAPSLKAARKRLQRRNPNGASFTETNPSAAGYPAPAQQPDQAATNPADSTPFFIIPTLPLAFPVHYLNAWATHIPLPKLTVESLFRQPVAYCLAVSTHVEGMLRSRIPDASWSACEDTPSRHGEFFEYLLRGASKLPGVYTPDDDEEEEEAENAFEVDERGYSLADVKRWIGVWKEQRRDRLGGESSRKPGKRKKMEEADDEDGEGESQTKRCARFANGVQTLESPQAEPTGVGYTAPAPVRCL